MRNISNIEINSISGGSLLSDVVTIVVGGALADLGAPAVVAGLAGYAAGQALEYDANNASASAALTAAYTSGAAL